MRERARVGSETFRRLYRISLLRDAPRTSSRCRSAPAKPPASGQSAVVSCLDAQTQFPGGARVASEAGCR